MKYNIMVENFLCNLDLKTWNKPFKKEIVGILWY